MRYELPPQAVLEGEIRSFNRRFLNLARKGREQTPFTFEPGELKQLGMADSTTTASFWKHFIGGPVNAIVVMLGTHKQAPEQFPVKRDLMRSVQVECFARTKEWQVHPQNRNSILEKRGYNLFLAVCTSFDWSNSSSETMDELHNVVHGIGNAYTMLEGNLPLHMIMHNLQEEGKIP